MIPRMLSTAFDSTQKQSASMTIYSQKKYISTNVFTEDILRSNVQALFEGMCVNPAMLSDYLIHTLGARFGHI